MTDREKAIVMAHTGICMLEGEKFQIFHQYVDDIMGRPLCTLEIGLLADEIKSKSKADFLALCDNESHNITNIENQLIEKLSSLGPMAMETAYLYALNYTLYGEDVTERWVTATQNSFALEKAYREGWYDAIQKQSESEVKSC